MQFFVSPEKLLFSIYGVIVLQRRYFDFDAKFSIY